MEKKELHKWICTYIEKLLQSDLLRATGHIKGMEKKPSGGSEGFGRVCDHLKP